MQTECSAERFGFAALEKRAVVAGLTTITCRRADVGLPTGAGRRARSKFACLHERPWLSSEFGGRLHGCPELGAPNVRVGRVEWA